MCLWGIYSIQILSVFLNVSILSDRGHKNTARERAETAAGSLVKPDFSTQAIKSLSCPMLLPSNVLKWVTLFCTIYKFIVYFVKMIQTIL